VSTTSSDLRRRHRTRAWATYGATLVSIVVIILVVEVVGHEAGHLFTKISQGLAR
jgi:uncharacterized membrane protein YcjF (UPF0283 family)